MSIPGGAAADVSGRPGSEHDFAIPIRGEARTDNVPLGRNEPMYVALAEYRYVMHRSSAPRQQHGHLGSSRCTPQNSLSTNCHISYPIVAAVLGAEAL